MPNPSETSRLAEAIVAKLGAGLASSEEVFAAFAELDALPPEVVRQAMGPWVGPAPDLERLDDATRRAHGLPPRRLVLRTLATAQDADLFDLGETAEAQLALAGKSWDGLDLPAEERLDGEVEGSFAGTLVRRVLGDSQGPRYDMLTFAEGAGMVFRADTTDVVAFIADGRVETRDRQLREALEVLLAADEAAPPKPAPAPKSAPRVETVEADAPAEVPAAAASEPTPSEPKQLTLLADEEPAVAPVKKRAAAKKVAAPKKVATKKAAAKAKEPAPKKAAAKKTAAKKTAAAKEPAPKKAAAKKTAAKKTTAKKTTAKKASAK